MRYVPALDGLRAVVKLAIGFALGVAVALGGHEVASRVQRPAASTLTPVQITARLHVRALHDVERLRAHTLREALGGPLPAGMVDGAPAAPMLGAVSALRLPNGYWLESPGDRLAIYHAGHKQDAVRDAPEVIRAMLRAGYDVLALNMPSGNHDLYAGEQYPLRHFINPVAEALNFATARKHYHEIIMVGLSGGGWTTVLYSALDTRISRSYPIAGSWPFPLREGRSEDTRGDFEQRLPGLSVGYIDLYLMAASKGREQVQIFNLRDPCCYAGTDSMLYRASLAGRAYALGGRFDVIVVDHDQHSLAPGLLPLMFPSR